MGATPPSPRLDSVVEALNAAGARFAVIGGFAVMELSGIDEAIAVCQRYAAILGGTLEIDVRLVDES